MTVLSETESSSLQRLATSSGMKAGGVNPVGPLLLGWLLLALAAGHGSDDAIAAGGSQGFGHSQALTSAGYEYYPEYPTEPVESIQKREIGYQGFHPQQSGVWSYAAPFSQSAADVSGRGFKFRDLPAAPKREQPVHRFRPDSLMGRSPYTWGREDGRWPEGSIGPPPVFRPLEEKPDKDGAVARQSRYSSGGDSKNRRYEPGRAGYDTGSGWYRPLADR